MYVLGFVRDDGSFNERDKRFLGVVSSTLYGVSEQLWDHNVMEPGTYFAGLSSGWSVIMR